MLPIVGLAAGAALAAAMGWLLRRRSDVLHYHQTDTAANRVGRSWLWSRHGGR